MSDNRSGNGDVAKQLDELLRKWVETLPKEFTLGSLGNGSTSGAQRRYPDLHFKADETIPGLYYADLDVDTFQSNGIGKDEPAIEFKDGTEES